MKLVIQTQCRENYGAHTWDGEGECPQYWKYKGGETYIVPNLSVEKVLSTEVEFGPTYGARLVENLRGFIEDFNEGFEEYIIDLSVLDDDIPPTDDWYVPINIEVNDDSFTASTFQKRDEYSGWQTGYTSKSETWTMLPKGGRKDYTCEWEKE